MLIYTFYLHQYLYLFALKALMLSILAHI